MQKQMQADMDKDAKQEFAASDKNSDGKLSYAEFTHGVGQEAAEGLGGFSDLDKDKDGQLSLSEYVTMFDAPTDSVQEPAGETGFPEGADQNGDKYLSEAEFVKLGEPEHDKGMALSAEDKKELAKAHAERKAESAKEFKAADKNHDGKLSVQEYTVHSEEEDSAAKVHAGKDVDHDGFLSLAEFKEAPATDEMSEEDKKVFVAAHAADAASPPPPR